MKGGRESTRPPPLRAPGKGNKKRRKSDLAGAARQSYNDKELCKFVFPTHHTTNEQGSGIQRKLQGVIVFTERHL